MKRTRIVALILALAMVLGTTAFAAEYTVKRGDTLSKIAKSQLGDASRWKEIFEANKDTIKDPNKIVVGQKLTIPGDEKPSTGSEQVTPTGVSATATATGFEEDGETETVTVTVTVADGKITAVAAASDRESPIGQMAIAMMPDEMVKQNTVNVDVVAGATGTSTAILEAARKAMAELTEQNAAIDLDAWALANGYVKAADYNIVTGIDALTSATEIGVGGVNFGPIEWTRSLQEAAIKEFLKGGKYVGDPSFYQDDSGYNYREMYQMATTFNNKPTNTNLELVLNVDSMKLMGVSEGNTGKTNQFAYNPEVSLSWVKQLRVENEEKGYNYYSSYGVTYNGTVRVFTLADLDTTEGQDALIELFDTYYPTLDTTWRTYGASLAGLTDPAEIRAAKLASITRTLSGPSVVYEIVPKNIVITAPFLTNLIPQMSNATRFTLVHEGEDKYDYDLEISDAFIDRLIDYKNAVVATADGKAAVEAYYSVTGPMGPMVQQLNAACEMMGIATSLDAALATNSAAGLKTQTTWTPGEVILYRPGFYAETAQGFGGDVTVRLTVGADGILNVTVLGPDETSDVGGAALDRLAAQIMSKGAKIDGVSGATVTSNAARLAAAKALAAATGADEATLSMTDGSYTKSVRGFDPAKLVTVTVEIEDNEIVSISVVDHAETNGFIDCVEDKLIDRILDNQSLAVDAIVGATSTSNAVKAAVLAACLEAGADELALYAPIPGSMLEETYDVDVVVVGMGGSGTAAALSAVENGATVMAIDKAGKWAGTSAITSGPTGVNVPSQVEKEIPDWTDAWTKKTITKAAGDNLVDRDALYQDWTEYTTVDGVQHAKVDLIELELDMSGAVLDWLTGYGFQFKTAAGFVGGKWAIYCAYEGNKALTESFFASAYEKYTEAGGKYMLETEAYDLIVTDGVVTGVKAVKYDGTQVTINAKNVILATGGFGGNEAMMEKYLGESWRLYGMAQNDGKMIQAAIDNGANTYNIGMPPMSHFVAPAQIMTAFTPADNDIPFSMIANGEFLIVDKDGVRQMRESSDANFFTMEAFTLGSRYYSILSKEQVEILREQGFSKTNPARYLKQGAGTPIDTPLTNIDAVIKEGIELGIMYKASSLEELAGKLGMSADNLKASVEGYQAAAEGTDPLGKPADYFARTGAPASDSEYYIAVVGAPYIYSTVGALDVNVDMQVLDKTGDVIPGLYAVGTDSMGVLFTDTKGYANYGGIAQGYCFTSGKVAGAHAATASK